MKPDQGAQLLEEGEEGEAEGGGECSQGQVQLRHFFFFWGGGFRDSRAHFYSSLLVVLVEY